MKKILFLSLLFFNLDAEIIEKDIRHWDFDDNYAVLDVRTKEECKKTGLIKNANIITVFNLDGSYNSNFVKEVENKFKKSDKIAIVCRSGARSMMAAKILEKAGFKNLVSLNGGMLKLSDEQELESCNDKVF